MQRTWWVGYGDRRYMVAIARDYEGLKTTNNRMELLSVIVALKALKRKILKSLFFQIPDVVDAVEKNWIGGL